MTPLYFGSAERKLFGVYAPPTTRIASPRAIVVCAPWGQEYLCAHRSLRQLGTMLSASGHHVLRFDYFGTGDSAGELAEATMKDWETDIEASIDEIRETSGSSRISMVGLRLGASLGARVGFRLRSQIDSLVLWDPVVEGRSYVSQLRKIATGSEVEGFVLSDVMAGEMAELDLATLSSGLPGKLFLLTTVEEAGHERLRSELRKRSGPSADIDHIEDACPWRQNRELGAGAIPAKVLEHIVRWLK